MEEKLVKFGIDVQKINKGDYSIGACISSSNWGEERDFYLFINLFKYSISIGWIIE